jgi:hypothetical protein
MSVGAGIVGDIVGSALAPGVLRRDRLWATERLTNVPRARRRDNRFEDGRTPAQTCSRGLQAGTRKFKSALAMLLGRPR